MSSLALLGCFHHVSVVSLRFQLERFSINRVQHAVELSLACDVGVSASTVPFERLPSGDPRGVVARYFLLHIGRAIPEFCAIAPVAEVWTGFIFGSGACIHSFSVRGRRPAIFCRLSAYVRHRDRTIFVGNQEFSRCTRGVRWM